MGRKAGITLADLTDVAASIADHDGIEAVTMTAVASALGIKTPSLYNHVGGLAGVRRLLAWKGSEILLEMFQSAVEGKSGVAALRAIAEADREFARLHPGLYASFLPAPTEEGDPELYAVMAAPVFLVARVLLDMGIPQEKALHQVRAMRAMLHGFLDLEAQAGFGMPIDIDRSFREAVELVLAGIEKAAG